VLPAPRGNICVAMSDITSKFRTVAMFKMCNCKGYKYLALSKPERDNFAGQDIEEKEANKER
jgi:hypothetical protein